MDTNGKEGGYSEEDIKKLRSFHLPRFYIFALIFVGLSMFGLGICVGNLARFKDIPQAIVTNGQQHTQASPVVVESESLVDDADTGAAFWKVYEGSGYTIQYPPDFTVTTRTVPSSLEYPETAPVILFANKNGTVTLTEAKKPAVLTVSNALGNGPYTRYTQDLLTNKTKHSYTIGGVPAISAENIPAGQEGVAIDVLWIQNNTIYQATAADAASAGVLKKMLATFTFTN